MQPPPVNQSGSETEPYEPPKDIARFLKWNRRHRKWTPVVTVALSLLALIMIMAQAFIYDQQRKVMNDQRDVMQQQVQVTEKSLRITERAYVGVAMLQAD